MKLMLDVHLVPGSADALRRRWPKLDVQSATEPGLAVLSDPLLLEMLDEEGRVLVTRDVNSMPDHVKTRMCAGLTHGGVIFVPSPDISPGSAEDDIRTVAKPRPERAR